MQSDRADIWLAAALGLAGLAQAYALYLLADWVERRTGPGRSTLRPIVLVAGLACLWPELTSVGDWLVAARPDGGTLVWALIIGMLVGAVLPRPARRRRLPPDATMDEREED